jgi:hypothetical protein
MMKPVSVGFLGGGPVTQAIHLPVLARMQRLWRISRIMDVNPEVARLVAERCGAIATTEAAAVIEDPTIDVIAICSPNSFHAEQAIAACRAGKRAVLCEKPLATSHEEAEAIAAAAKMSDTVLMVGTMHLFDPAYRAALSRFQRAGEVAHHVKSAIYLPPNAQLIGMATEEAIPSSPPPPAGVLSTQEQRQRLRNTILGLAIHHVPLVRQLYPSVGQVLTARRVPPFGYSLLLKNGAQVAELLAFMPGQWPPSWTFEAATAHQALHVEFPPSYVAAGSGHAHLIEDGSTTQYRFSSGGYDTQWLHLYEVLTKNVAPWASLESLVSDMHFALDLADQAAATMEITE